MIINDALRAVQPTITALPWVERYGGVSFPFRRDEGGTEVNDRYVPNYKNYPVSDTMTGADCTQTHKYKNLIPDHRYKNLLYWEVTSDGRYTVVPGTPTKGISVVGTARLVYWMNLAKHGIQRDDEHQIGLVGADLAGNLMGKTYQATDGVSMKIGKPTFLQRDPRKIFPYDYGKDFYAMLLYPYGFGAVSFEVTVHISPNCLPDITNGTAIDCITEW